MQQPLSWCNPPLSISKRRKDVHQCEKTSIMTIESSHKLHAQRKALQLIIVVSVCAFVEEQRRDAYYRNDPSKYGLNLVLIWTAI